MSYEPESDPSLLIGDVERFLKNSFSEVAYEHISVVLSRRPVPQHLPPVRQSPTAAASLNGWRLGALAPVWPCCCRPDYGGEKAGRGHARARDER
ncbi:hypothetical protein SODG_006750 [Sodalis praecaptivus]